MPRLGRGPRLGREYTSLEELSRKTSKPKLSTQELNCHSYDPKCIRRELGTCELDQGRGWGTDV